MTLARFLDKDDNSEIAKMDIPWPPHISASFVENNQRYVIVGFSINEELVVTCKKVPMDYGRLPSAVPSPDPETKPV